MQEIYNTIKKQEYKLSYLQENIETISYSIICFFIPFLIAKPQFLVGMLVNCALILAALNIKNYKLLPIIILPSIGVLTAGLIFGPLSMFLIYMIPFIWISNFIIVYSFKYLYLKNKLNKWTSLIISAIFKVSLLFISAFILVKLSIIPALFLTTMGLVQLYTAISGGIMAFAIQKIKTKYIN
ncbi:MAG: hypothetical protein ACOC3X_01895 [Nanoarchaeota archaeon]